NVLTFMGDVTFVHCLCRPAYEVNRSFWPTLLTYFGVTLRTAGPLAGAIPAGPAAWAGRPPRPAARPAARSAAVRAGTARSVRPRSAQPRRWPPIADPAGCRQR